MEAGKLRHRVLFERLTETLDSEGALVEEWTELFDGALIPAEVVDLSGRELIAAGAIQSNVNTRIIIRYMPGIVPKDRAVHRGVIYNIDAVINDPKTRNRWLTLQCASGVNEG